MGREKADIAAGDISILGFSFFMSFRVSILSRFVVLFSAQCARSVRSKIYFLRAVLLSKAGDSGA